LTGWLLPVAAAGGWLGALLGAYAARVAPWWAWGGLAAGLLALGWAAAPRRERGDPLAVAGLAAPAPEAASRLDPGRLTGGAGRAVVLVMAGVTVVSMARAALAEERRLTSPLAGMRRVTMLTAFREDPREGLVGWFGVATTLRVEAEGAAIALREPVWISGDGPAPRVARGDLVRLEGSIDLPDDGGFALGLAHRGIAVTVRADVVVREGPAPNPIVRGLQAVRTVVGRSIERLFPPREAGLLLGLALGDDSRLDPVLDRDFRAAGLGHLLVVSGGNVAMVLAPVLCLAAAVRLTRWPRFALGLGIVGGFVVLTGGEPSVLRAGVMAGVALVGVLLGRPRTAASTLAGSVLALLLLDPWLAWAVGFQLSAVAAAGMVAMAGPIAERLGRWVPTPLAQAAGATIAAQIGVTPLLLFHFGEVPLVTIIANVVAFPAVSPAMLLGLAASATGMVWSPAGHMLAWVALWPMRFLEAIADRSAKAPVGHLTAAGGPVALVVGGVCVIAFAWWLRSRRRPPRALKLAGLVALPLVVALAAAAAGPPASLTVTFFDVGQGDAALVRSPAGATILVDGGPEEDDVATELAALGVRRLDVVVASHPHADHVIGLPAVLSRYPVGLLLSPGCPDTSVFRAEVDRASQAEGVPTRHPRAGSSFAVGDLEVEVLSPDHCWTGTESDANNDALVLRVSLGDDAVLFATEPEEPAQEWLLESGTDLRADVLKVPHHGAATSVPEFFQAVGADVAVVSVGENTYGHPVPTTLDAISEAGAQVWRTDRHGDITISLGGGKVTIESDR
jgi:competence protein ComEC